MGGWGTTWYQPAQGPLRVREHSLLPRKGGVAYRSLGRIELLTPAPPDPVAAALDSAGR